jgi:Tfp pilus assembly protein PilE
MSTAAVVIVVILAVIVLLAVGGAVATARRTRAREGALHARVREANDALAAAHAEDKGWEREALEAAARRAYAASRPNAAHARSFELVQVVDRPGTEEDQAVFRVLADDGEHEVRLGRRGGDWVAQ